MYLYNLTLQKATGITHAVHGSFSGQKIQEILISRGKSLELLRPDPNTGKIHTLLTTEVFGVIRSLIAFRLTGGTKGESSGEKEREGALAHSLCVASEEKLINFSKEDDHNKCAREKHPNRRNWMRFNSSHLIRSI